MAGLRPTILLLSKLEESRPLWTSMTLERSLTLMMNSNRITRKLWTSMIFRMRRGKKISMCLVPANMLLWTSKKTQFTKQGHTTWVSHMTSITRLLDFGLLVTLRMDKCCQNQRFLRILWLITQRKLWQLNPTLIQHRKKQASIHAITRK